MHKDIMREIIPLTPNDCFTLFSRTKKEFNFPLHYHDEFELNFIINAKGAKRIVGDSIEVIENDVELILIGPNLYHAWFTHMCKSKSITEITIQWHKDLFDDKLLCRNQLNFFKCLLNRSQRGLYFSKEAVDRVMPRIKALDQKGGFASV